MELSRMSLAAKRRVLEESMELLTQMEKWAGKDKSRQLVVLAAMEGMEQLRSIPERV